MATMRVSMLVPLLAAIAVAGAAAEPVKLPGITIDVKNRCVDVEAAVSLNQGTLELVACTKDSKTHESIVEVNAKAMHIHTALLLLGAKPGNPAMQKAVGEDGAHWVPVAPKGGPVDVFLAWKKEGGEEVEHPIRAFLKRTDGGEEGFPTNTFLFAGSRLVANGAGPRRYLADGSGNVVSLSTFGDETLCLPGVYGHQNSALLWEVDDTHLPPVGTKVILRLKPRLKVAEEFGETTKEQDQ